MSNKFITADHAIDTLGLLRRSAEDLTTLRRLVRRASKDGRKIDVAYVRETLAACLSDLIESCTHLSQGDDADRLHLSRDLAARIIEEDSK